MTKMTGQSSIKINDNEAEYLDLFFLLRMTQSVPVEAVNVDLKTEDKNKSRFKKKLYFFNTSLKVKRRERFRMLHKAPFSDHPECL